MGWFDSQIKERLRHDEDLVSQAARDLSVAITGRAGGSAEVDAGKAAADAVAEVLAYYHVKPAAAPRDPKSVRDLVDAQLRGTGMMCRRVTLSEGWQRDATGAMLGFADGVPVALLPQPAGGFAYLDHATAELVRVDRASAARLSKEAYCFYQPLPQRELSVKDVLLHMARTLDVSDYVMIVAATLAVTLLGMLLPVVNNLVFGPVVASGNVVVVAPIAVLLVSVTCSQVLIGGAKALVMARIDTKLSLSVQAAAMMRTLSLPAPFYRAYASGDLSARLSSMETLAGMLQDIVLTTGLTSVFSLAYVAQIAAYAPGLAAPALGVILATVAVAVASMLVQINVTKRTLEYSAHRHGWEYALFTGIQKIRLAGAERRAYATWVDSYKDEVKLTYNGPRIVRYAGVAQTAVSVAGTIVMYLAAVQTGVTVAEYMAFNSAYGMATGAFMSLAAIAGSLAAIKPHLDMAAPIMKTVPESAGGKQVLERCSGRIEMDNVTFRYAEGAAAVLDGLSLKIRPGQSVGVVGKTGCGKSTLMRLLLGFEKPQKGAVLYDGRDIETLDVTSLRRNIGTVLQDGKLFTGDIYANIVVAAPWLTLDDAWEAAELAGIADDIRAMPMGMNTMVSEGSGGISGGQRQRILIARAVAPKPKVLFFDEATSALDNVTQRQVSEALEGLKCTRIIVAHRLSTIRNCDRIIVLDGGRVVEDGTYEELCALGGVFAELVERQTM